MTETSVEIKRSTQVLEVMGLLFVDPTKTIEAACDVIGIAPSTYYYWVQRDPDALRAMRNFLADTQKLELSFLSAAVTKINMQLAHKALSDTTDVGERLKIAKYLNYEAEKLQRIYQVTTGDDSAAEFLKQGPQLKEQDSRFASVAITPDDDGGVKVDFYRKDTVIDSVEVSEPLDEPE